MIKLLLPPTIAPLLPEDLDEQIKEIHKSDAHKVLQNTKQDEQFNKIVEGYVLKDIEDNPRFNIFAEININNDNLWNLFKSMMMAMPEMQSLILSHKDDDEVTWSEYLEKYSILNILEPHAMQLSQDVYINFGVIHQTKDSIEEIFVHSAKYIQYWGTDKQKFIDKMHKYSIYEVKGMKFVDNFPTVSYMYQSFDEKAPDTRDLIEKLREKTGDLHDE